ncbi:hypothetical protein JYB62_12040 [Algoriphagus lutimaris]|uniref:hypothetical protein n=1 Tax=Algoriphagus lutimaris TaxID=613197 RepID=UPI00196B5001|nr:hypothetical protein [Algoriphagus lutimaris]MBN3520729.1 hypothetical protein [Algoriphagus lutimaris]
MKSLFLDSNLLVHLFFALLLYQASEVHAQTQAFELDFNPVSFPSQFLPGWYGNEVRNSSSRIFQEKGHGVNQSHALAVQPISTFNGELIVRLSVSEFTAPKIQFLAKSSKNGNGSRAAEVYFSWSNSLNENFSTPQILGSLEEFPNEEQEFRLFEIHMPDQFKGSDLLFFKLEVRYGNGAGTCARWLLDDFVFGDIAEDTLPPSVQMVRGFNDNEIQVEFSEAIDPVFSIIQLNYKLDGQEPDLVRLESDSLATLTFSSPLVHGEELDLQVSQIPDLAGNFIKDTLLSFRYHNPILIPYKSLVINEIMPAPKADLDLPNVEYVELRNNLDYPIRTKGMAWSNSRNTVELSDVWIDPEELILLVPSNQQQEMREFGTLIPVGSWPTLLNAGDQLELKGREGDLVDRISYSSESWDDPELRNSGFSLEVVNPFLDCEQSTFLKVSNSLFRGTPGSRNSVFDLSPDEVLPWVQEIKFLDSLTLQVQFSEPIKWSFEEIKNQPELDIDTVYLNEASTLKLELKSAAAKSIEYRVSLYSVLDCAGNGLKSPIATVILSTIPLAGDVIINELLFNPQSGRPKFVELYNRSSNYLQIGDLQLGNLDANGLPDQLKKISESGFIFPPQSYLAITTDTILLKQDFPKSSIGNFLQVTILPSYPISGGTVVLFSEKQELLEEFSFDEEMHHPLMRDPKGVSLERISINAPSNLKSNWHSASGVEDYGTPGKKNSNSFTGEFESQLITISPEVFDPEGNNGNTFTVISYELDQPGWVGTFEIYDVGGRIVKVLDRNAILGNSGMYNWSGTDDSGRKVRPGYYVLLVELFDLQGEVIRFRKTMVVATQF